MQDTLAALAAAIIDAPTDRTVRLVYADALDESGDPAHAARAEFIRAHVALEAMSETDPQRAAVAARCSELFADHWIDWWQPVCVAVGLPEPYVPKHRLRDRMKRLVNREKRPLGAPYTAHADAWSVRSEEHGFTAQFIAGFPELLYIHRLTAHNLLRPNPRWFTAAPFCRLRFAERMEEWAANILGNLDLHNVAEFTFDRLSDEFAARLAAVPNLAGITTLKVLPLNPTASVVREVVCRPVWSGLRSLTLSGVTTPDAIQMLAERCTLEELESLSFGMCEVPPPPPIFGGLTGAVGLMLSEMMSRFFSDRPMPPGPISWSDYWPALDALARSPVLGRLRTLQVIDVDPHANTLAGLFSQFGPGAAPAATPESQFPDNLLRALAEGLNVDKVARLELPAARLTPAGRAALAHRFGPRLVLA